MNDFLISIGLIAACLTILFIIIRLTYINAFDKGVKTGMECANELNNINEKVNKNIDEYRSRLNCIRNELEAKLANELNSYKVN